MAGKCVDCGWKFQTLRLEVCGPCADTFRGVRRCRMCSLPVSDVHHATCRGCISWIYAQVELAMLRALRYSRGRKVVLESTVYGNAKLAIKPAECAIVPPSHRIDTEGRGHYRRGTWIPAASWRGIVHISELALRLAIDGKERALFRFKKAA